MNFFICTFLGGLVLFLQLTVVHALHYKFVDPLIGTEGGGNVFRDPSLQPMDLTT